jgi:hypothetical protein
VNNLLTADMPENLSRAAFALYASAFPPAFVRAHMKLADINDRIFFPRPEREEALKKVAREAGVNFRFVD